MEDGGRFNDAVETLLADRSPAAQARHLDPAHQRMLVLAQLIRGSRQEVPDANSIGAMRSRLERRVVESARR